MKHQITLKALLSGRPVDAAHVLANFAPILPANPWEPAPSQLLYETLVARVIQGVQVVVEVETQKDLWALGGHFWVEPRVLPEEAP